MDSQNEINKLREIFFDNALSHFVILDKNLKIIEINKTGLDHLGIQKHQLVGKKLPEIDPDILKNGLYETYLNVIKTGVSVELEMLTAHIEPLSRTQTLKLNAFKVKTGLGFIINDVTFLKNAINELELIKKKLRSKNLVLKQKNTELKKLSNVITSHLKNPINEIHKLIYKLIYEFSKENHKELNSNYLFEKINETSNLLNNKINALQEINDLKIEPRKKDEKVDLNDILNSIKTEISEKLLETQTVIKIDFSKNKYIYFNSIELHSVLYNLINNSIKYRNPTKKNVIEITSRIINKKKLIQVKDNGIGFDSRLNKGKIFSIFKRMHTHVRGLGVGLYIVKSIIDSYGGYIEVKSKLNQGTTFKIYLPIKI